jgi:hypothetical protein
LAFADANRTQIRYIEESVFGTTPGSGSTREVRLTSSSLSANKETIVSDELRSDRMVSDIVEVAASSGGEINFEWSSGPNDEFIAAFLLSEWTRPMTMDFVEGSILSVTATDEITVAGRDVTDLFVAGRRIKLVGWPTATNNGYFEIASSTVSGSNTVITITETTLTTEVGVFDTRLFDANDVIILKDDTIAFDATGMTSAGTPFAAGIAAGQFVLGQKIYVQDFIGLGPTGYYTITSLADDAIGLIPPPPIQAAGAAVTVKGSHVRNPGDDSAIQQRYFSLETAFQDIGQFMNQDGMVPGTFSLEVATGAIVTGTIGFEGRATDLAQSTTLGDGGTYTIRESHPGDVVNATTDVGDLVKDGSPLLACIQSISLSGEAGLRMQNCVGEKFPRGIGTGRFNLTGSMTVYFEDEELFDDFINHNTISLEFSITDSEGISYHFKIPALKISQNEISPGGIDQDVFENIEFTAFRDATTDTMFQIDRFSPN